MAEKCTVCYEIIDPSTQAWSENSCDVHYAHTLCVREHKTDFGCSECDPSLAIVIKKEEAKPSDDDDESTLELVVDHIDGDLPQSEVVQPPISLPPVGIFSSIQRLASKVSRDRVETSENPFFLVANHYPVELFLKKKKKMGLYNLVNEHGISIGDFARAKYTFKELLGFPEIDCDDGFDTLIGMGLDHNTLYAHRRQLPFEEIRAKYGVTSQDVIDRLRYKFCIPEDGGWSAKYLIKFGFTMDQLMACGLKYSFQFDSLMLSSDQFKKLGCTNGHLKKLKNLKVDEEEEPCIQISHAKPSARRPQRSIHTYDDECIGQNFLVAHSAPIVIKTKKKERVVPPPIQRDIRETEDVGYVRVIPRKDPSKLVFPGEVLRKKKFANK